MNLNQSRDRKFFFIRYCTKHGLHYHKNCPVCFMEKQPDLSKYNKGVKKSKGK